MKLKHALSALGLLLLTSFQINSQTPPPSNYPEIFKVCDEMPHFPIGDTEGMSKEEVDQVSKKRMLEFIYRELEYPALAMKQKIEGTVVVEFIIEKDGTFSNVKIANKLGGGCDEEALRIINAMFESKGPWEAGKQKGRSIRASYTLPIRFKL